MFVTTVGFDLVNMEQIFCFKLDKNYSIFRLTHIGAVRTFHGYFFTFCPLTGARDGYTCPHGLVHMPHTQSMQTLRYLSVRYHCGGWPEEVSSCVLNSYMVYL
jgi:hypothetical protein